jgi:hypothetical protein
MDKEISLLLYPIDDRVPVWNNFIIAITGSECLEYYKICLALEKLNIRMSDTKFNAKTRLIFESESDKLEFMLTYG